MNAGNGDAVPRRRAPRVNADGLNAVLESAPRAAAPEPVSLLNISEAGVAVLTDTPLGDVDEGFALRLGIGATAATVKCECVIRYVLGSEPARGDGPRWLHGAEFLALEDEALRFLGSFVRGRLYGAATT